MSWSGKKVLVCGGAGMIGSHLARELLARGAKVTIADDLSSGSTKNIRGMLEDAEFLQVDLREDTVCDRVTKGKEVIFQLAADMGGIGYITSHFTTLMINNNAINTNMLMAAHLHQVENYFFSSSACVYPNFRQTDPLRVALKESDAMPADPNEPYGWEKFYCEKLVECFQCDFGSRIHVARFHNIYGSAYTAFDEAKAKAPCKMIIHALQYPQKQVEIWNDGQQTRSFLYISDCVEAILRLMETDHLTPINIGSEQLISMNDLAKLVIDISGKPIKPVYFPDKPQGVRGRNSDNTLVREVLKWEPQVSLEDGLAAVYGWAKLNLKLLEGI